MSPQNLFHVALQRVSSTQAPVVMPSPCATSHSARYVGRVGLLAVALGVGAAVASMPTASADSTGSAGSSGSVSSAASDSAASDSAASAPAVKAGPRAARGSVARVSSVAANSTGALSDRTAAAPDFTDDTRLVDIGALPAYTVGGSGHDCGCCPPANEVEAAAAKSARAKTVGSATRITSKSVAAAAPKAASARTRSAKLVSRN